MGITALNMTRSTKLNISEKEVTKISITSLPSPPKVTTIEDKDKISELIKKINEVKVKKSKQTKEKGWKHLIEIQGGEIYKIQVSQSRMIVNGDVYEVENIEELVNFLDDFNK